MLNYTYLVATDQIFILLSINWSGLQTIIMWFISGHYYILLVIPIKVVDFTLQWNHLYYTHYLRILISGSLKIPWSFLQILHGMTALALIGVLNEIWPWHKEVLLVIVVIFQLQRLCLVVKLDKCFGRSYMCKGQSSQNVHIWSKLPSMVKVNKDTAGKRHVVRRYNYVRQGTTLNEHAFLWIDNRNQLADILTKSGNAINFSSLWSIILYECKYFLSHIRGMLNFCQWRN